MVPRGPRGITTGDFGLQCDCIANTTHTRNALMGWTIHFVVGHKHRLREILVLSSFGFIRTSKRNFCSIVRDVCGRNPEVSRRRVEGSLWRCAAAGFRSSFVKRLFSRCEMRAYPQLRFYDSARQSLFVSCSIHRVTYEGGFSIRILLNLARRKNSIAARSTNVTLRRSSARVPGLLPFSSNAVSTLGTYCPVNWP